MQLGEYDTDMNGVNLICFIVRKITFVTTNEPYVESKQEKVTQLYSAKIIESKFQKSRKHILFVSLLTKTPLGQQ